MCNVLVMLTGSFEKKFYKALQETKILLKNEKRHKSLGNMAYTANSDKTSQNKKVTL